MGDDANETEPKGYKNYSLTKAEKRGRERTAMAGWRKELQASKLKFDDVQKGIYLNVLRKTGRKMASARAAGVSAQCVADHIQNDPFFDEAVQEALADYRDIIHKHAYKVAVIGVKEPIVGGEFKDQVVAEKTVYATNILAMEMKRVEPEYKDKSEVALTSNSPVLVAPAGMTPEEWIASQKALQGTKKEPGTE